jgi:glycosyltransferase involved in cell wall biosynthesis
MRASDILILPSYTEGLPLVLLEAMSQGLAVIASDVGGISEIVRDGETGLLFEAGNAVALADAITKLSADEQLRNILSENAREVAKENTMDRQLCMMFRRIFDRLEGRDRERIA